MVKTGSAKWGLWRRRDCLVPTWRGWLLLLLATAAATGFAMRAVYPFLAVNEPVPDGLFVVEGWLPDYALRQTIVEFERRHSDRLFVTGGPLGTGAPLAAYGNFAALGTATLIQLGLQPTAIQPVPAPFVLEDRTYTSAIALKHWLQDQHIAATNLTVYSLGPHARRTRLLYEKAFGPACQIGIIAGENRDFDPHHWWRSSEGVRTIISETIAYGYARIFFRPPADRTEPPIDRGP